MRRWFVGVLPAAVLLGAGALLAGCGSWGSGSSDSDCQVTGCTPREGVATSVRTPQLSEDGSEVTIPFWCEPSKHAKPVAKAITYQIATRQWVDASISNDALRKLEKEPPGQPVVPGHPLTARRCASDCSRYVFLDEIDPGKPQHHTELFYADRGGIRQLTHFETKGAPFGPLDLSQDGQRATAVFQDMLVVVDVPSGAVRIVPYSERIWQVCSAAGS